ncbi:hypothetical protein P280DRAFT_407250 [Massarina eburnea CBS 473.64]|uniref:Uncharacterized protein n=1 Tax=Massarina eburnea CBS 473.64 TaxID=1395130 RepID=A0A6A6RSU3_9PLEO|nr:hypothetical protein P280DRAFT_407250 [Massarina eburnea CBS 473.64]
MASESHQHSKEPSNPNASESPFKVTMQYDPQGEWTLHRLESATSFGCGQCNKQKKAKLVATRHGQWDDLCCNGCYGLLLSKGK